MLKFFCFHKISKFHLFLKLSILFLFQITSFSAKENRKDTLNASFIYIEKNIEIFSSDVNFTKQLQNAKVITEQKLVICERLPKTNNISKHIQVGIGIEDRTRAFQNDESAKQTEKRIKDFQKSKIKKSQWEIYSNHTEDSFHEFSGFHKKYISSSEHQYFLDKFFAEKDFAAKENLKFIHQHQYFLYSSKSLDFCFSTVFSVRPPPFLS
ncbi:hypothetical protein [Chryseobacterium turcicum]|uniref:Uncharacterized protein n=1 Tax=Chryseobacterium turcicum TaxID=2898076 RepID=A0A9Q3YUP7_9FLAO|nr:hypothetical protein [Chryseobacterium turcicum]MCD1115978.1 hypothetical protein [Chryseobacterium turcicum]